MEASEPNLIKDLIKNQSELTPIVFYIELTHLGSEASNYLMLSAFIYHTQTKKSLMYMEASKPK